MSEVVWIVRQLVVGFVAPMPIASLYASASRLLSSLLAIAIAPFSCAVVLRAEDRGGDP